MIEKTPGSCLAFLISAVFSKSTSFRYLQLGITSELMHHGIKLMHHRDMLTHQ